VKYHLANLALTPIDQGEEDSFVGAMTSGSTSGRRRHASSVARASVLVGTWRKA
jgi:hypothetical protein